MDELQPSIALDQWLETATEDLCATAVERITAEIREHYEDALQDALVEGLSPDEADQRAVAALGSPSVAARAFRRSNLTVFQARMLRGVLGLNKMHLSHPVECMMWLCFLGCCIYVAYEFKKVDWLNQLLIALVCGGIFGFGNRLSQHFKGLFIKGLVVRRTMRRSLLWRIMWYSSFSMLRWIEFIAFISVTHVINSWQAESPLFPVENIWKFVCITFFASLLVTAGDLALFLPILRKIKTKGLDIEQLKREVPNGELT